MIGDLLGRLLGGSRKSKRPDVLKGALQTEDSDYRVQLLYLEQWGELTRTLTPSRLARILDTADAGQIAEQHALYCEMEDRCDHLAAEMGKRKRALLTLDWQVVPADEANPRAREVAEAARQWLDMLPNFEDVLQDMADAIGHGFAALEIQWDYSEGLHVPAALTHRPQSWFLCPQADRNRLRLRDGTAEGAELWPYGWITHIHRSKSGWLPRAGLFRALAWTYLIRSYALNSEIAFVQIHGLPLRLGKYPPGSSKEDKAALLAALRSLGQDAAGIIPAGMEVVFETSSPATQDVAGQLVTRCEQGMSKAILGGTLTSQADGRTSTNALGLVHEQVRRDLLVSDAAQIASTLTAQLVVPLCALNLGITDRKLLPYFRFDTQEPADLQLYADAIPKLAPLLPISSQGVMERLKLPVATDDADRIRSVAAPQPEDENSADKTPADAPADAAEASPTKPKGADAAARAALRAAEEAPADAAQAALDNMQADAALAQAAEALIAPLLAELDAGLEPEALQARLGELYPQMDETQLADVMARALFVAEVWGRIHGGR